jgi:hypothetical protein
MAPPVVMHCVVHVFASSVRHCSKLLSWHVCWHIVSAMAVQEPVQSALHLSVQAAVVETETHCVVQWSSQQAPHDEWQSAAADAETDPSVEDDEEALAEHDTMQPD